MNTAFRVLTRRLAVVWTLCLGADIGNMFPDDVLRRLEGGMKANEKDY